MFLIAKWLFSQVFAYPQHLEMGAVDRPYYIGFYNRHHAPPRIKIGEALNPQLLHGAAIIEPTFENEENGVPIVLSVDPDVSAIVVDGLETPVCSLRRYGDPDKPVHFSKYAGKAVRALGGAVVAADASETYEYYLPPITPIHAGWLRGNDDAQRLTEMRGLLCNLKNRVVRGDTVAERLLEIQYFNLNTPLVEGDQHYQAIPVAVVVMTEAVHDFALHNGIWSTPNKQYIRDYPAVFEPDYARILSPASFPSDIVDATWSYPVLERRRDLSLLLLGTVIALLFAVVIEAIRGFLGVAIVIVDHTLAAAALRIRPILTNIWLWFITPRG